MRFTVTLALFLACPLLAAPEFINDAVLRGIFAHKVAGLVAAGGVPNAAQLQEAVGKAPRHLPCDISLLPAPAGELEEAVFIIGGVEEHKGQNHWHMLGNATAWALGRDGLMVTNYHVFQAARGDGYGVMDRQGNAYPVMEILAADPKGDVAIFRVKAEHLATLSVGADAEIGDAIHVISHPANSFYFHSFGHVARYVERVDRRGRPDSHWMEITADYAKGSSGGPVLNQRGQVVGMVSSTHSIYYNSDNGEPKGPLQMVVKTCVPGVAIRELMKPSEPAVDTETAPMEAAEEPGAAPEGPQPAPQEEKEQAEPGEPSEPESPEETPAEPRPGGAEQA